MLVVCGVVDVGALHLHMDGTPMVPAPSSSESTDLEAGDAAASSAKSSSDAASHHGGGIEATESSSDTAGGVGCGSRASACMKFAKSVIAVRLPMKCEVDLITLKIKEESVRTALYSKYGDRTIAEFYHDGDFVEVTSKNVGQLNYILTTGRCWVRFSFSVRDKVVGGLFMVGGAIGVPLYLHGMQSLLGQ